MAALRKVAQPKPKDDFWVEEYRRERSKSPMPGTEATAAAGSGDSAMLINNNSQQNEKKSEESVPQLPEPVRELNAQKAPTENKFESTLANQSPIGNNGMPSYTPFIRQPSSKSEHDQNNNVISAPNNANQQSPQQNRINSPFTTSSPMPSSLQKPLTPIRLTAESDDNVPIYQRSTQRKTSPSPTPYSQPTSNNFGFNSQPAQGAYNFNNHQSNQDNFPIYMRQNQRAQSVMPAAPSHAPPIQKQNSFDQQKTLQNIPIYSRPTNNVTSPPPPQQNAAPWRTQQLQSNVVDAPNYNRPYQTTNAQQFRNEPGRQYGVMPLSQTTPQRVMSPSLNQSQNVKFDLFEIILN